MWTAGSTISVQVINDIGMSIGQGVWSGWVALTSFLWGAFGHQFFPVFTAVTMRSRTGAFAGLALLLSGIGLLAGVGAAAGENDSKERHGDAHERQRLLGPDVPGSTYAPINDSARSATIGGGSRGLFVRGLLLAVLVGLCGGSTLVPIKFSPVRAPQQRLISCTQQNDRDYSTLLQNAFVLEHQ